MVRQNLLLSLLLGLLLPCCFAQETQPAYRNPKLTPQERAADLVKRMTLEEKVDQLAGGRRRARAASENPEEKQAFEALGKLYREDSQVSPHDAAEARNAVQHYLMEKTPLGIPAIFQGEALHGFMAYGSTSFPQVLGLASTWDPELVQQAFTAAADEMASSGVNTAFTPVLDLSRDPRWGRTEETYGEDPYLVARMGVAAINGLQGTSWMIDRHHVMATMKHFAAHGQPESGTNTAPANFSERDLRETFLVPFRAAVQEAHVGSAMASYNEIDGIPNHVNHWLLDRVLRQEWGFRGYVTSDGGGLQMLVETHHVAADFAEAARKALAAGVDYDLSDGSVYATLLDQVRDGRIPEAELDQAVRRVLEAKFRLGLFENPYVDPDYAQKITNSSEHQQLALKVAQKAIVLLKNDKNLLPLDLKKLKTIAVIGPNAADVHLGGYSRDPGPGNQISILDGIRKRAGDSVKVVYAEGCKITTGKQGWSAWYENKVTQPDPKSEVESIRAAATVARQSDLAIVVVGENESTNREAWSEQHLGDRDSLDLLGSQQALIQAIVETGKPVVVLLINGRPLSINYVKEHVPAILEGWYLGEQGGTAAANVLFGDVNPGGKLPISFPRSVGQLPAFYDHKPSRNRSYLFDGREPIFPFGYGLSYTQFRFENVRVEPKQIRTGGSAKISVDITNAGSRSGDEVAQLYIHQRVASITRPVMQLRGFKRVSLEPGQKITVDFTLTPEDLSLIDVNMNRVVEPGMFDLMVGPSSANTSTVALEVINP
ncbi:MAG TPA: glycoside hydrolase family 3 N-terminal domain-containing protein [Candidatus Sulfotelmatobacter sp.]|nr:glycoside hydrolase family 3 N-terminal domain-containing protein [Candidatus Sulfotelmatobacter sp.]